MAVGAKNIRPKMTKEEFKQLPEGPPYYEFEYGEVIKVPSPHPKHNDLVIVLGAFLRQHTRERRLGLVFCDVDVDLTPELTYAPDVLFIRQERASIYNEETGEIIGTPDLCVEIVSPKGASRDRVKKFNEYGKAGVEWYWLIDLGTFAVEEYHLENGRYVRAGGAETGETFRPQLFPDLDINLQNLIESNLLQTTTTPRPDEN